jgi:hypothetical protein
MKYKYQDFIESDDSFWIFATPAAVIARNQ